MDKLELVIPSVISQSLFMEGKEFINLNGSEINYFYLLLYLYREKLLKESGILDNNGDKNYTLNQDANNYSVEIKLWWFDKYKAVKSKKYEELKSFLKKLKNYSIVMNVLEKNKEDGIEKIKLVKSYSINKTTIKIEFNKSFLEKYIVYGSQFMPVDLNKLIKIRGKNSKLLYLLLKDYSNLKNGKDLTVEDLMLIFGSQEIKEDRIEASVKKINALNDIKVNLDVVGPVGEKIYKFKFEKEEPNSNDKIELLSDFPEAIQNEARIRMEDEQANGTIIKNEERYLIKVCKSIVIENEEQEKQEEYKIQVDAWLQEMIKDTANEVDETISEKPILILHIEDDKQDLAYFWFVNKKYQLEYSMDENNIQTKNAKETIELIDTALNNDEISLAIAYYDDNNNKFEKMYY